MAHDQQHQGAAAPGPNVQSPDGRINQLDDALRSVEVASMIVPQLSLMRDSTRAAQTHLQSLGYPGRFSPGVVIHAMPYVNWYKLQVGDGAGWIAACDLNGAGMPLGPRPLKMCRPGDKVMVFMPRGLNHGFIIGVIPPAIADGRIVCPDWISQGSNAGLKREDAHLFPIQSMYRRGGVIDWSANRPMDQTAFDQGWIAPSGLAIHMSDWLIQVRVNEMCGLFMSWFDSWCRLAGIQLLIESAIHEEFAGDDEGEAMFFRGIATYPWEALGLYAPGTTFTQEHSDKEVQYEKPVGKVEPVAADAQPMYRYQEFGGYLGQGHMRSVCRPALSSGIREYQPERADDGLFRESIGIDGDLSVTSAKRVYIGKRSLIVQPKRIMPIEHGEGDDGTNDNYKFSGQFGNGDEHKITDLVVDGDLRHVRRAAGVQDIIAYLVNWKALHPFHYHQHDYKTWQEGETSSFEHVQEHLNFATLAFNSHMPDPSPVSLHIDHRFGDVEYFERESFLVFHDDGTVQLGAGCGEHMVFGGGDIEISTPGKLKLLPGTDLLAFASQVCVRSKGSIDFSSSERDVRFKAERNMQFLAGNKRQGGMLFECRSTGNVQQFKQKFGEDVQQRGIVFKAPQSVVAALAKDIYLRTGGPGLGSGDILLDAGRGNRNCQIYAKDFHTYTTNDVTFNYGPIDENSSVNKVYYFGKHTAIFDDVHLLVGGKFIGYKNSGVLVEGGVYGTKSFASAGVMADKKGFFLGKVPGFFGGLLSAALSAAASSVSTLKELETERHKATIVDKFYQELEIGNTDVVADMQFSFRDPPGSGAQYKVDQLKWPESRWQMMTRMGMASGGAQWDEQAVTCQGEETYPYPGRKKWKEDEIFLQLDQLSMFDPVSGRDKDRPYDEAKLGTWKNVTMESGFKLIR